ncbi:hypothetical protein ABIF90_007185 [Bradyrhizobium japonicum]
MSSVMLKQGLLCEGQDKHDGLLSDRNGIGAVGVSNRNPAFLQEPYIEIVTTTMQPAKQLELVRDLEASLRNRPTDHCVRIYGVSL